MTMKTVRSLLLCLIAAVSAATAPVSGAAALPVPAMPVSPQMVVRVAGDCYSIGQQVAAENGGTLARASSDQRGGQAVCVIVVLVPGQNGERPRRAEFVVPAN